MNEYSIDDIIKKIDWLGNELSITIKGHLPFKCISTYRPDWYGGIAIRGNRVTWSGNLQHPHALDSQLIFDHVISNESILKIKKAIIEILENE